MLVKQGKIDGQKIGHKWYVHLPSAQHHFHIAKQEQEIQRKKLSDERKAELKKFSRTSTLTHHRTAVVETLVIMIIGLSLGVTGYLGTTTQTGTAIQGSHTYLENLALSLYTTLTPQESQVAQSIHAVPLEASAISAHLGTTTTTSLIIAPNELLTTTTVESIQDSFADPVSISVDPTNPTTGIIIPDFKNTEGEAYRFLMVPVTKN